MTGYQRFVAYVYEYRKGKKGSNCGFVKVEARDGKCRIEVHLKCEGLTPDMECKIYGFVQKAGELAGILLGTCQTRQDKAECFLETDADNLHGSNVSLKELGGMVLLIEGGGFYGTQWDEQPIRPENFVEMYPGKQLVSQKQEEKMDPDDQTQSPVQQPVSQEGATVPGFIDKDDPKEEESRQPQAEAVQEASPVQEPEEIVKGMDPEDRETRGSEEIKKEEADPEFSQLEEDIQAEEAVQPEENVQAEEADQPEENIEPEEADQPEENVQPKEADQPEEDVQAEEADQPQENVQPEEDIQPQETVQSEEDIQPQKTVQSEEPQPGDQQPELKGASVEEETSVPAQEQPQVSGRDTGFDPFGDGEIIQCRKMDRRDFSFLNRRDWALRNNRFLLYGFYHFGHILVGRLRDGQYILGVPGLYDQQERFMANMFGFPHFKYSPYIELPQGKGGYWYRLIYPPNLR